VHENPRRTRARKRKNSGLISAGSMQLLHQETVIEGKESTIVSKDAFTDQLKEALILASNFLQ
jgi:hypothetical protein